MANGRLRLGSIMPPAALRLQRWVQLRRNCLLSSARARLPIEALQEGYRKETGDKWCEMRRDERGREEWG